VSFAKVLLGTKMLPINVSIPNFWSLVARPWAVSNSRQWQILLENFMPTCRPMYALRGCGVGLGAFSRCPEYVSLLVTSVSPAETAELIEMLRGIDVY